MDLTQRMNWTSAFNNEEIIRLLYQFDDLQKNTGSLDLTVRMINRCMESKTYYALFMNSVSWVEYYGVSLLSSTQKLGAVDKFILDHQYDELRHAKILKGFALKMNPELATYEPKHMLGQAPRWYCYRLLGGLDNLMKSLPPANPMIFYFAYSVAVECRALWLYNFIDLHNKIMNRPTLFDSILKDETGHMVFITDKLQSYIETPAYELSLKIIEAETKVYNKTMAQMVRFESH